MHEGYNDILKRIPEPPKWWDENGTPRYDIFTPDLCPDIYANLVWLMRIACQNCDQLFEVEMHANFFDRKRNPRVSHYGDPPVHGCIGDTMNCEDLEILQVWHRESTEWERYPEQEGKIE